MPSYYDVAINADLAKGSVDQACKIICQIQMGQVWVAGPTFTGKVFAWPEARTIRITSQFEGLPTIPGGSPAMRATIEVAGDHPRTYGVVSLVAA